MKAKLFVETYDTLEDVQDGDEILFTDGEASVGFTKDQSLDTVSVVCDLKDSNGADYDVDKITTSYSDMLPFELVVTYDKRDSELFDEEVMYWILDGNNKWKKVDGDKYERNIPTKTFTIEYENLAGDVITGELMDCSVITETQIGHNEVIRMKVTRFDILSILNKDGQLHKLPRF